MTFPAAFLLWLMAFSCHVRLHPLRYGVSPLGPHARHIAVTGRIVAPGVAWALSAWLDGVTGVLIWFASLSIAGLCVALCLASRRR
ncbi:hypothetical protein [Komagataeibacter diospyri]|uniref:Uncharacterized protein n=1 Tax=Komagataeibacter diospyri TaxID=1932662 RepID=A0A4P5NWH9_9PROT|nr:hypothetical protein [Komagataeibacter diospyri]GCE82266.1 hypothetical protein MSKU9_0407 [Komagataeibacter diospyri]